MRQSVRPRPNSCPNRYKPSIGTTALNFGGFWALGIWFPNLCDRLSLFYSLGLSYYINRTSNAEFFKALYYTISLAQLWLRWIIITTSKVVRNTLRCEPTSIKKQPVQRWHARCLMDIQMLISGVRPGKNKGRWAKYSLGDPRDRSRPVGSRSKAPVGSGSSSASGAKCFCFLYGSDL
jgi:hypothetical protein